MPPVPTSRSGLETHHRDAEALARPHPWLGLKSLFWLSFFWVATFSPTTFGQIVQYQASEQTARPDAAVRLNLRGDVELRALVEYVGKRLNLSFVYDDEVANKRVNVRAPDAIPVDSLLNLLGSVLKAEGMILVEDDIPGWLRIVDGAEDGSTEQTLECSSAAEPGDTHHGDVCPGEHRSAAGPPTVTTFPDPNPVATRSHCPIRAA